MRIHLMLFGSYRINERKDRPARISLQCKGGQELNFYSCVVQLIEEPLDEIYDWTSDVMSPEWDAKKAREKLREIPDTLVCEALLDQQIFYPSRKSCWKNTGKEKERADRRSRQL